MSKRNFFRLALALSACLALFCGCGALNARMPNPLAEAATTLPPEVEAVSPRLLNDAPEVSRGAATLYFRLGTEPYLAPESRVVSQSPSQAYEMALIAQLLSGPGAQSQALKPLFPEGTRVLSTVRQGRTLFVTLSREIMDAYPDEPVDWQESDHWRVECRLRRKLCMQSLVATVTENCDVDQVQVLVQQSGEAIGSLRLRQNYFLDDSEDNVLVGPMTRDASLLLEPDAAIDVILSCWRDQDWQRLYPYLTQRDPQTGEELPALNELVKRMTGLPGITAFRRGSASIAPGGEQATYAVDFTVSAGGGQTNQAGGRIVRLYRENGLWKTSLRQLTGWMEE